MSLGLQMNEGQENLSFSLGGQKTIDKCYQKVHVLSNTHIVLK